MMRQQLKPPAEKAGRRILELRGLLYQLTVLTRDLGPDTDLAEAVGIGRELWRTIELAHKRLNVVKDRLRDATDGTPGQHRFAGPDSSEGLVHVPEPVPVIRKEVSIPDLRTRLGDYLADVLFVRNVSWKPSKDFQTLVATLNPKFAKIVLDAVDMPTGKPRVTFIRRNS